jgi:hypothetical protein
MNTTNIAAEIADHLEIYESWRAEYDLRMQQHNHDWRHPECAAAYNARSSAHGRLNREIASQLEASVLVGGFDSTLSDGTVVKCA